MFRRLLLLGVEHRQTTSLILLILSVIAALGLSGLKIETGSDNLIPANDPSRLNYQRIAAEFGSDNRSIIYIRDDKLWSADKLNSLQRLHAELDSLSYVTRSEGLFNLQTIKGGNAKVSSIPLIAQLPKDEKSAQELKQLALDNPLIIDNFLSRDGSVTAIIIAIKEDLKNANFNSNAHQQIEALLDNYRDDFSQLMQVGSPRINAELKQSLYDDFTLLIPLSCGVLLLAILFFLRNGFAALVPLATSALSILWTFGFMGWADISVNILIAMLPSLILVIGSTEDTHMLAAYFHALKKDKKNARVLASKVMIKRMGLPLFLTILTTTLGFSSNIFSPIGMIQDFAIAATFAMISNGFITLLLVPLLLSHFGPTHSKLFNDSEKVTGLPGLVVQAFDFSQHKFPRLILVLTGLMCSFFVYQASKLYVTNDPLSYFPEHRPLIQDTQTIHRDLSGIKTFFITVESTKKKAFYQPKNLQKLLDIQQFLDEQGIFDNSISIANHLNFVNREFQSLQSDQLRLPQSRELVAQYLLFFHRSDIASYISHDFQRANIVVRHNVSDSHTLNQHIEELEQVIPNIIGNDLSFFIVGENLMINRAAENLMLGQIQSLGVLLAVIFIIMSIMFTSFKGGFIALIPALIPIILMFGIMGLMDIPLNPGTAMVAVIAIGIAVDGTIHLFSRYNELCRHTPDYLSAISTTVREEATPLVASSLALATGFGILLLSNFTVIAQFGALASATMLFSIFANLLITPLVMTRVRLVSLHQILTLTVDPGVLKRSPLFKNMTNYQRRKAILISEVHEFAKGEKVIVQDTTESSMYLLLSGSVDVNRCNANGVLTLAQLQAGDVFGEIGFINKTLRTADVEATCDVSVLRFDHAKLRSDLRFFPNIIATLNCNISSILGARLAEMVATTDERTT